MLKSYSELLGLRKTKSFLTFALGVTDKTSFACRRLKSLLTQRNGTENQNLSLNRLIPHSGLHPAKHSAAV